MYSCNAKRSSSNLAQETFLRETSSEISRTLVAPHSSSSDSSSTRPSSRSRSDELVHSRRPRACGARFAVDAHRRLARKGTRHAPHASVDGEGVGLTSVGSRVSPVRGPWRVGGRRTGRIDMEGVRGVDHGARPSPTTVGVRYPRDWLGGASGHGFLGDTTCPRPSSRRSRPINT